MENKRSVLVIEDDAYLISFYNRLQSELAEPVSITIVESASEGIDLLEKNTYDAVILDLIMPELDGYEVLKFLQLNGKSDSIDIAILTNLDTEEDRKKTTAYGANSYYVKSDLSNSLLQSILLGEN